jgi:hypothetical protein
MAVDLIAGGAAALTFVKDTFTTLLDMKVDVATRTKITDALTKLGEAQAALFSARESLFALQEEKRTSKRPERGR